MSPTNISVAVTPLVKLFTCKIVIGNFKGEVKQDFYILFQQLIINSSNQFPYVYKQDQHKFVQFY